VSTGSARVRARNAASVASGWSGFGSTLTHPIVSHIVEHARAARRTRPTAAARKSTLRLHCRLGGALIPITIPERDPPRDRTYVLPDLAYGIHPPTEQSVPRCRRRCQFRTGGAALGG